MPQSRPRRLPVAPPPPPPRPPRKSPTASSVTSVQGGDSAPLEQEVAPRTEMTGWLKPSEMLVADAPWVEINDEALIGRARDDSGEEMHGAVFGNAPIKAVSDGFYYEVMVREVRDGFPDGLVVGVTTTNPAEVTEIPETVERIQNSWTIGYDGQMWDPAQDAMQTVDWDPSALKIGDRVGVLVTRTHGEMLVFLNGEPQVSGPRGIPVTAADAKDGEPPKPLYALVDLLGNARAVSFLPGAEPPV